jgi:hypothetical protein
VVVGAFQAAGLITAERRRISIADAAVLQGYACACYQVIRDAIAASKD